MTTRLKFELPRLERITTADQAREVGIDYQTYAAEASLSYGELVYYTNMLEDLAKRFDLLDEFRENGVI